MKKIEETDEVIDYMFNLFLDRMKANVMWLMGEWGARIDSERLL